ncbi:toxin-antitoxin system YwqK family antitoxin [Helicobacter sp. T3_23-1059]
MKSRAIKGYKGILAGVAMIASLVASVIFSGCDSISGGSYCDDKNGQQLYTKLLKEFLVKNDEDLKPHIDKVDFVYEIDEDLSSIDKEKKSASCIIKNVKLKFDTKDTMTISGKLDDDTKSSILRSAGINVAAQAVFSAISGESSNGVSRNTFADATQKIQKISETSRFIYKTSYTKDNKIEVSVQTIEYVYDIPEHIKNYYDGTGVLIDGKKKGGCKDGVRQERDKNGEISFEGGCTNGTKDGAWKYYDNGFLAKEELYKNGVLEKMTKYYPITGIIKSDFLKDDKGNATLREYDEKGYITKFVPYITNEQGKLVVNGKMFNITESRSGNIFGGKSWLDEDDIEKVPDRLYRKYGSFSPDFFYVEAQNGVFVRGLSQRHLSIDGDKFKTQQEMFDYITTKHLGEDEVIVLGNLSLVIGRYGVDMYKNNEPIGSVEDKSSRGLCTTGQCQVMFKELIDKSIYKDEIYSMLESAKPE